MCFSWNTRSTSYRLHSFDLMYSLEILLNHSLRNTMPNFPTHLTNVLCVSIEFQWCWPLVFLCAPFLRVSDKMSAQLVRLVFWCRTTLRGMPEAEAWSAAKLVGKIEVEKARFASKDNNLFMLAGTLIV